MTNDDIEHLDFPVPEEGDESETSEVDPATVAKMDQEQQAFTDSAEAFARTYGFVHHCHCAEDYASGNTKDVPECFLRLAQEAMGACAIYFNENKQLRVYLSQMLKMTNDLGEMLKANGHGEDLEKYFTEEMEQEEIVEGEELQGDDIDSFENEGGSTPDDDDDNLSIA